MKNEKNYQYPLDETWSNEEITTVIKFYNLIEAAYEVGVDRKELLDGYRNFQKIVPMKMDQNSLSKEFEKESGYVIYQVIKQARNSDREVIKM